MKLITNGYGVILATAFFFSCSASKPVSEEKIQEAKPLQSELFNEVLKLDSLVFGAFNNCEIEKFRNLFTDDLEFYHDKGGLTGIDHSMKFLNDKCTNTERTVRRALVPEGMEVYPIKDYGAIQVARHNFFVTEKGQPEKLSGTFKFLHVWKKTPGGWKIARVISYDH